MNRVSASLHRMHRLRVSDAAVGLLGTVVLWLILAVFAALYPPRTPIRVSVVDLVLLAWISEFLYLKSWLMICRTELWDRLGISIIAVNLSFAILYQLTLAFAFWPPLAAVSWLHTGIRAELALVVTWGAVELLTDV